MSIFSRITGVNIRINWTSIGKRLGLAATVAMGSALTQYQATGKPPSTTADLVGIAATALVAAFPAGSAPSGIATPAEPGAPSLTQVAAQSVAKIAAAPAQARQQAVQEAIDAAKPSIAAATIAELQKTSHGETTNEELAAAHAALDALKAPETVSAPIP